MTLKAAIIGCGRMAGTIDDEITYDHADFIRPYGHAPGYAATEGVELVAASDIDADRLNSWCDRFNVEERFTDHGQLLEQVKPDVVSVTTPAHARANPLVDAVESGVRGIYTEKALCTSQLDLDRIVSAVRAREIPIVYGAMRRYWRGFETARAFLDAGHLGAPQAALIGAAGGSAFHTHSHIIDAAFYLLGDPEPLAVQATLTGRGEDELGIVHSENDGVAVDTDRGLLVPVVRDVDRKNIIELAVDLGEIAVKARDRKLSPDEMQGACFTISNLGGIGGIGFTPIVNPPEVAILGVARGGLEPVHIDGQFQPRMMLPLSLSYDHRLIDGADGARFLRWLAEALANPFLTLLEG